MCGGIGRRGGLEGFCEGCGRGEDDEDDDVVVDATTTTMRTTGDAICPALGESSQPQLCPIQHDQSLSSTRSLALSPIRWEDQLKTVLLLGIVDPTKSVINPSFLVLGPRTVISVGEVIPTIGLNLWCSDPNMVDQMLKKWCTKGPPALKMDQLSASS